MENPLTPAGVFLFIYTYCTVARGFNRHDIRESDKDTMLTVGKRIVLILFQYYS